MEDVWSHSRLMKRYNELTDNYSLDQMEEIIYKVCVDYPDNCVLILRAIQKLEFSKIADISVSGMLTSVIDPHTWFVRDYFKTEWILCNETGKMQKCPRQRVYLWEDDATDYNELIQTLINTICLFDPWIVEKYVKGDAKDTEMFYNMIKIYDVILDLLHHDEKMSKEEESDPCGC